MSWWKLKLGEGKSGKREVAVYMILCWSFCSAYLFYYVDHETLADYKEMWTTLTWAVLAWAAGAFGIDFMVKSGVFGGQQSRYPEEPQKKIDKGIEGPL